MRPSLSIVVPEKAVVKQADPSCGDAEVARAEAALGAAARELEKAGFAVLYGDDMSEAGAAEPLLLMHLAIRLEDCREGLYGDVALELRHEGRSVERIEKTGSYFSNVAALAVDLGDRVAGSTAIRDFGRDPVRTSTSAGSTVSR